MANQRSAGTSGAFDRAIRQLVLHGLPTTSTRTSEAALAAMAWPWGPKIPPLTVSRSPRSMPALRGIEPTSRAHEVPSKAVLRSVVVTMSLTRGNAQSSSSMTTPSSACMPGSISSSRSTTGWSGPNRLTRGDPEEEGVADLAGGARDGDVDGGLAAMGAG